MYFLVEIIRDDAGLIVERNIVQKTNKKALKRGGEFVSVKQSELIPDIPLRFAIIEMVDNEITIIEDPDRETKEAPIKEWQLRVLRMDYGKKVMALVVVLNDAKVMDKDTLKILRKEYAEVSEALFNGYIEEAEELIADLKTNGDVSQDDKNILLAEISMNKEGLGYE